MYKLIITSLLIVVVGTIVSILLLKKIRRAKSRHLYNRALKIKNKIERGDLSIGILPVSTVDTMQDLLIKSGRLGNSKAWFELAMFHYLDMGLTYDKDSKYLEQDTTGEMALLKGYMLYKGYGYQQDLSQSIKTHLKSASQGNAEAMFELYIYHHFGYGTAIDQEKAIEWCLKAAKQNQNRALYNLGTMYATGYGSIAKDMAKAISWYKKAVDAGHGKASATLSVMYAHGTEVKKDLEQAKYYFEQCIQNDYDMEAESMFENYGLEIPDSWYE